jgi:hypothetical protein
MSSPSRELLHKDFRSGDIDGTAFRIFGPEGGTAPAARLGRGLRMSVPAGHGEPVGLTTRFGLRGDFEITATFDAPLPAPPAEGYGAGPELLIKPVGNWQGFASMSRLSRRGGGTVDALVHGLRVDGRSETDGRWPVAPAAAGRFRLAREGDVLRYLVADTAGGPFRELFRSRFGIQDVEFVRLAAITGGSRDRVEVLWRDLTIRAERFVEPEGDDPSPAAR